MAGNSQRPLEGVSVVIVSYNVRHVLASCLDSVLHSAEVFGGGCEVIVVDNNSRDGTRQLRPRYPGVRWIFSEQNIGFGPACNRGAREATGSLLIFLNPDTIVEENTLQVMWDFFARTPGAGVAGCRIRNPDNSLQLACRRSFPSPRVAMYRLLGLSRLFPKSRVFGRYNLTYLDENAVCEVDAVSGSFLCLQKRLFGDIGGFDEDFFMYGEDLDLCYRAKLEGRHNFYTPETTVLHFKGESAKSRPIGARVDFYKAMIIFSRKHFEQRVLPLFLVYLGAIVLGAWNFASLRWRKWQRWSLDLLFINAVLAGVTVVYSEYKGVESISATNPDLYLRWHALLSLLVLSTLGYSGDYGRAVPHLKTTALYMAIAILGFFTFGYFFYETAYSRIVFGVSGLACFASLVGWRAVAGQSSLLVGRLTASTRRVVIVGLGDRARKLRDLMLEGHLRGYEFLGFVPPPGAVVRESQLPDVVCGFEDAPPLLAKLDIHEVIIAEESHVYATALKALSRIRGKGIAVKILVGDPKPRLISLVDLIYNPSTPIPAENNALGA